MYVPSQFRVEDPRKLAAFIGRHSFATLTTYDGAGAFASHLPMLFDPERGPHGTLVAHMARANPQWRHFASGSEAVAIFQGPHAYVSPSWYATEPAVPTWNYAAVHAYGVPQIVDDHDRVVEALSRTIAKYESGFERPWSAEIPNDYRDGLIQAIVAFEIPIARIEGKFKLSQNRSVADRQGVYDAFSRSARASDQAVAELMVDEGIVERSASFSPPPGPTIDFAPVEDGDFEELAGLRLAAMRESLVRLGRFDPERSRERFRNSFRPDQTHWILVDGRRAGFYALRPIEEGRHLDHLYVHPLCQSRGVGTFAMQQALSQSDALGLPVTLGALRGSDANRFYLRFGFVQTGEDEWDVYYRRPASVR